MFEITIVYNTLDEFGGDGEGVVGHVKTFKGKDEVSCLRKIMTTVVGEVEDLDDMNAREIYREIMGSDDGSVYVVDMFVGKPTKYKPSR